jgi:Ca2+-binding RTX toxin-like protein
MSNISSSTSSIVIIDPTVADYDQLIAGLQGNPEIFILDPKLNGISQITSILSNHSQVSNLQIISHGSDSNLYLGNTSINQLNIDTYKSQLNQWSGSLTDDADILLYGCNVASSSSGVKFIQTLSELTGADVAASNDLTGNASKRGDWDLEVNTGNIETLIPFAPEIVSYNNVLNVITVDINIDEDDGNYAVGDISLREAIANVADGGIINFANSLANNTIPLNSQLLVNKSLTIDGASNNITISGSNSTRVFFVNQGSVNFFNLTIDGGRGKGGDGGRGGGGGGGMGGGLFINNAQVTVNNVTFQNNHAIGGNGGYGYGGGGGGFGGSGGDGAYGIGGGGGGFGGNGGDGVNNYSGGGGGFSGDGFSGGFGGSGGGGTGNGTIFGGGLAGGGGGIGSGGGGGIGGGGGGGGNDFGATGGFGGIGGGGGGSGFNGGNGGDFGGGGSGSFGYVGGYGGFGGGGGFGGAGHGGNGGFGGGGGGYGGFGGGGVGFGGSFGGGGGLAGGGGGGLGGAIFLRNGSLSLNNTAFSNNAATGGLNGSGVASGQGKGGAIFISIGASATSTGTLTFTGNSAVDDTNTPIDNDNIYGSFDIEKTFHVTNINDSGTGSLRQAIIDANADPGVEDIIFDLDKTQQQTINLLTVLPDIGDNGVNFKGIGADKLTVARSNTATSNFRIFKVNAGAVVSIDGMTISNGSVVTGAFPSGAGGGIYNDGGTLSVTRSAISGNSATFGGGIFNSSAGTIKELTNSVISGNSAPLGGGIFNQSSSTISSITNSTLSNNTAERGGGIFNNSATISSITNSTLSNNTASNSGGGIYSEGGEIAAKNTIVAGNTATSSPDFGGSLRSNGYNLIGNTTGTTITGDPTGNIINVDAKLGTLQNNSGTTQTIALLPGSPAINAGDNTSAPSTDQRELERIFNNTIDIGAYEFRQDIVTGTNNNDNLSSTITYPDLVDVTALAGNDYIKATIAPDNINGGDGIDGVIYSASTAAININLAANTASGGDANNDTLINIEGIQATNYNDILTGNDSNNYFIGGSGADVIDGGMGIDTALYTTSTAGVNVNLTTGTGIGGDAEGDTITNIEDIQGSNYLDTLTGNDGNNYIYGWTGNDNITGNEGNDSLIGGSGADALDGGIGIDTASYVTSTAGVLVNLTTNIVSGGDAEGDTISNIENVQGSIFVDTLTGNNSNNNLDGNEGNDSLQGGSGADTLDGGIGIDTALYTTSTTAVNVNLTTGTGIGGDAEGDTLSNIEYVQGSNFNDTIIGDSNANYLYGFVGNDILNGNEGNDILVGGSGADVLDGGIGIDTALYTTSTAGVNVNLSTGAASGGDATGDTISNLEYVQGSNFNDTITGDGNTNYLYGFVGNDILNGNEGNDYIYGGTGADVLDGGIGIDTALYTTSTTAVNVNLSTGTGIGGDAQGDTLNNIENVQGSNFNDTITGNGNNNLYGFVGNDTLTGKEGNDYLFGGIGSDALDGGMGIDTAMYTTSSAGVNVNLTTGTGIGGDAEGDTLSNIEYVQASKFKDTITGNGGNNKLYGYVGDDILNGDGGNDSLYGGVDNDILNGGIGTDYLDGGDGIDTLTGANLSSFGVGEIDYLTGNTGADTFVLGTNAGIFYNDGVNTNAGLKDYARVLDFNVAEDLVQLTNNFSYYLGTAPTGTTTGGGTGIFIDNDGTSGLTATDELIGTLQGVNLGTGAITSSTAGFTFV